MPVYRNKYKYQLISPIVGTRVYQTTSLMKGAKKCFEELASFNNLNVNQFSILDIDTYETYKFQFDQPIKNENISGQSCVIDPKLGGINEIITDLSMRIRRLEEITNVSGDKMVAHNSLHDASTYNYTHGSDSINRNANQQSQNTVGDDILAQALSNNIYNINRIKATLKQHHDKNDNELVDNLVDNMNEIPKNDDQYVIADGNICTIM